MALLDSIIGPISQLLDRIIPDPRARDEAKLQLLKLQGDQEMASLATQMQAIVAALRALLDNVPGVDFTGEIRDAEIQNRRADLRIRGEIDQRSEIDRIEEPRQFTPYRRAQRRFVKSLKSGHRIIAHRFTTCLDLLDFFPPHPPQIAVADKLVEQSWVEAGVRSCGHQAKVRVLSAKSP